MTDKSDSSNKSISSDIQSRELLVDVVSVARQINHLPSEEELKELSEYSPTDYKEQFGNLFDAYDAAGIVPSDVTRSDFEQTTVHQEDTDEEPDNESVSKKDLLQDFVDLTGFKRDILIILNGLDNPNGLRIKDELEKYYEEEIHHGRLYPNIDDLVDEELIQKAQSDGRENSYRITQQGKEVVHSRIHWERSVTDSHCHKESNSSTERTEDAETPDDNRSDASECESHSTTSGSDSAATADNRGFSDDDSQEVENERVLEDILSDFDEM